MFAPCGAWGGVLGAISCWGGLGRVCFVGGLDLGDEVRKCIVSSDVALSGVCGCTKSIALDSVLAGFGFALCLLFFFLGILPIVCVIT